MQGSLDKTLDNQKGNGDSFLGKIGNSLNQDFDIRKMFKKKEDTKIDKKPEPTDVQILGYLPSYGVQVGYDQMRNPNYNKWEGKNVFSEKFTEDSIKEGMPIKNLIGSRDEDYTMPSQSESNFKFDGIHDFEDPTFLTFDIIMYLDQRALWDSRVGYGVDVFLERYQGISERQLWRKRVLQEFRNQIKTLFYTSDDNYGDENLINKKSYYINKIQGLQNLKKPIIKYRDDKITITLSEDLKMKAEYIAELYNNLSYDYLFKREAVPESCLRFDMAIVISDIRRFKQIINTFQNNQVDSEQTSTPKSDLVNGNQNIYGKIVGNTDGKIDVSLPSYQVIKEMINKSNVSRQVYIIRDCTFDFSKSQNVNNEISQGGFNASADSNPSSLEFDIYYKSAERTFFADLFKSSMNGQGGNLTLPTHNLIYSGEEGNQEAYYRDKHENILFRRTEYKKQGLAKVETPVPGKTEDQKGEENKRTFFGGLIEKTKDKMIDSVNKNINNLKDKTLQEFREFRGELLNTLLQELRNTTQVPAIQPDNVYDPDFNRLTLENFIKGLGADLYNDIESSISGGVNDFFNDAGL